MSIVSDKDSKATLMSWFCCIYFNLGHITHLFLVCYYCLLWAGKYLLNRHNSEPKLLLIWNLFQRFNIRSETNDFKKSRKRLRITPKKLTFSVSFCSECNVFYSNQPYIQFHCLVVLWNGTNLKLLLKWLFPSNSDLLLENVEKCSIDCD